VKVFDPASTPETTNSTDLLVKHGPHRKHLFHCCVFSRCRGNNMSTELFPSNGCCTVACLHSCYLAVLKYLRVVMFRAVPCVRTSYRIIGASLEFGHRERHSRT
jgi:hypothetical protein